MARPGLILDAQSNIELQLQLDSRGNALEGGSQKAMGPYRPSA